MSIGTSQRQPAGTAEAQMSLVSDCRRELGLMHLGQWLILIYIALQPLAIARLLGTPHLPAIVLLTYRLLDLFFIVAFFRIVGARLQIRAIDGLLFAVVCYPALVGLVHGQLNVTFFNDIAIYSCFIIKVVMFRTLLARTLGSFSVEQVFRPFHRYLTSITIITALGGFIFAQAQISAGKSFYYQAPAELTLAAAVAFANGHIGLIVTFIVLAALSGKRMILVGVIAMGVYAAFSSRRRWGKALRGTVAVLAVAGAYQAISIGELDTARQRASMDGTGSQKGDSVFDVDGFWAGGDPVELEFLNKLRATYKAALKAREQAEDFEQFLAIVDPGRFVEYLSLQQHLQGAALIYGNGYGFRYRLDQAFLAANKKAFDGSVSNAHFTPLAIVAKFGVVGLVAFALFVIVSFKGARGDLPGFQYACRLALFCLLVQSLFAFGFFVSLLTPLLLAVTSIKTPKPNDQASNSDGLASPQAQSAVEQKHEILAPASSAPSPSNTRHSG